MEAVKLLPLAAMVVALIIAIVGHEIMHGLMAYRYGDDTAKNQGRLSPNPLLHIDPVGTLLVPALLYFSTGFLFGWAKPVPVYIRTVMRNGGYLAAIQVSLAGIAYNIAVALVASAVLHTLPAPDSLTALFFFSLAYYLVVVNVILAIFNLYPLPPLDGSHALGYFSAWMGWTKVANFIDTAGRSRYGLILLMVIVISPLSSYLFAPMRYVLALLLP